MKTAEYKKWFHENLVRGEKDILQGIYNYTVGSYKFTTKLTKSGHLSLYDVTNGKVCVANTYLRRRLSDRRFHLRLPV